MTHTPNTDQPLRAIFDVDLDAPRPTAAPRTVVPVDTSGDDASDTDPPAAPADTSPNAPPDSPEAGTAALFVRIALDGRVGEAHRQAAQTALTVATEHGFVDDPLRVAEAVVVFLHPDDR